MANSNILVNNGTTYEKRTADSTGSASSAKLDISTDELKRQANEAYANAGKSLNLPSSNGSSAVLDRGITFEDLAEKNTTPKSNEEVAAILENQKNNGSGTYTSLLKTNMLMSSNPGDVETTYVDANGDLQTGINRGGKTYDASGNEITGGFVTHTADDAYYRKNADGTTTRLSNEEGAAIYNNAKAKGNANAAEANYQGAQTYPSTKDYHDDNLIEPASDAGNPYAGGATKTYNGYDLQPNPGGEFDSTGRYWTTIYSPNGTGRRGYIYNGYTYYEDGKRIKEGDYVWDAKGEVHGMTKTGGTSSYDVNGWLDNTIENESQDNNYVIGPQYDGLTNNNYYDETDSHYTNQKNGSVYKDPRGGYTIFDGAGNTIATVDSAGIFHPNGEGTVGFRGYDDPFYVTWENTFREWADANGVEFHGNGVQVKFEGEPEHFETLWLKYHKGQLTSQYPDFQFIHDPNELQYLKPGDKVFYYGYEPFDPESLPPGVSWIDYSGRGNGVSDKDTHTYHGKGGPAFENGEDGGTFGGGGTYTPTGKHLYDGKMTKTGDEYDYSDYPTYPTGGNGKVPQSTAISNLTETVTGSNADTATAIEALNNLVAAYGNDYDGLRQRLEEEYGTTDLEAIREMIMQNPGTELNLDFETSDAYKEAESIYKDVISDDNKPTLNFEEPNRDYEEYSPTDYTVEINDIYDKKQAAAIQAIKDQLEIGELDIDHAIEKLPGIYESGMNDMSTQFEMNKRNANEYFAANGLTSGAKAQALLAMNNVYQTNMSAYRLEQANAQAEYEHERTKLKMESQAAITEAIMQNDTERASALLAEYQRQDEYNFKYFLEKIEQDYKYWAQQCQNEIARVQTEQDWLKFQGDAAMQIMQLEEDRRYKDNQQRIQAAEFAEQQRQFTIQTGLDLAKLEESIRQNNINTELTIAELAQKDGQFKINAQLTIAELAEKMRQFGIDTNISLAKLAEQQREFDINAAMSQAELQEKIREFTENLKIQNAELDLKKYQIDVNADLALRELQEKARQADQNFEATMAKNNTSQKKTSYVGGSDQGTTLTPTTPSPSTVLGTLSNGVSITYGELSDIVGENSDAFNAALIQMSENQENQYEYSDDTYNDNNLAILKRLGESIGYTMDYNGQPTAAQYAHVANLLELYQLYFG